MDRIEAHQKLAELLKQHGASLTSVRKSVFDALLHREPQFMHEVIDAIGSAADRASVYRTIDLFESLGIVQRLVIGWKYKLELTDMFSDHHHHLSCTSCGKTIALRESQDVETLIHDIARTHGFLPEHHVLEIRGLCRTCQQRKQS